MRKLKLFFYSCFVIWIVFFISPVHAQNDIKLGAYYFDGWTGKTSHVSDELRNNFSERKPVWGWTTSTPEILDKQISAASNAGLDFFSFCWYYNPRTKGKNVSKDVKNQALNLFRASKLNNQLEYTLLVANHTGYTIVPEDWDALCEYWVNLFLDTNYLKVKNKPLITFFDINSLVKSFGSKQEVEIALQLMRKKAIAKGFEGVLIAANVNSKESSIALANECGFDVLTAYNNHNDGLRSGKKEIVKIDSMRVNELRVWDKIVNISGKPIIPVVTLNWDRRPWDRKQKGPEAKSPRFSGFSGESTFKAVKSCKSWIAKNHESVLPENIAILYAWNEYGEGAWLTPSSKLKNSLLEGVKAGLSEK